MGTIDGSLKPKTYACTKCGGFLWTEGICDPCAGNPFEQDSPSVVENVVYKRDSSGKVTTKPRKK